MNMIESSTNSELLLHEEGAVVVDVDVDVVVDVDEVVEDVLVVLVED